MKKRLYFLIPDRQQALEVVDELVIQGINKNCMHAVGDRRTRLDGLPQTLKRQNSDAPSPIDRLLWNTNLTGFALGIIAAIILPIHYGLSWWLLLPGAIFSANFLIGLYLTTKRQTQPVAFRDALAHGEILLLVDVSHARAEDVETRINQRHPEASAGIGNNLDTLPVGL